MFKWLLFALTLGAVLLMWRIVTYSSRNLPRVGDEAPGFELPDQHGSLRARGEFRGNWLVLYFFPRADTPG
jgi:peroxiredoxin Q/BCP